MNMAHPPVAATWLLERFSIDAALEGDLMEKYRRERSAGWYWRQALLAVLVCSGRDVVAHRWLALRAVVTGWLLGLICFTFFVHGPFRHGMERLASDGGALPWWLWTQYGKVPITIMGCIVWLLTGWLVGVLHRPYQAAMVLVYTCVKAATCVPSLHRLITNALSDPAYHAELAWQGGGMMLAILCLLIGGLWSTSRDVPILVHSNTRA
jgi:hypothetical protein